MNQHPKVLIAYVPVPHAGYIKLFREYAEGVLYLLGDEYISAHPSLVRHLPGARPGEVQAMISALNIFAEVRILTPTNITGLMRGLIYMPDEDVSRAFAHKHLPDRYVEFDGRWRLRWDWGSARKKARPEGERIISRAELDRELMQSALDVASRSPDWWLQVGALLVDETGGVLLASYNRHMPHEQSLYMLGDPRSSFNQGQNIEISGAGHAEPLLFAEAARRGIRSEGCSLYLSTFPCPPCAYMVAHTGIKRLFYADGYSLIAGAETLDAKGVEIIRVEP